MKVDVKANAGRKINIIQLTITELIELFNNNPIQTQIVQQILAERKKRKYRKVLR